MSQILPQQRRRIEDVMIICSWCTRINIGGENWQEFDFAMEALRLNRSEIFPMLSHGMCEDCYRNMTKKLSTSLR